MIMFISILLVIGTLRHLIKYYILVIQVQITRLLAGLLSGVGIQSVLSGDISIEKDLWIVYLNPCN